MDHSDVSGNSELDEDRHLVRVLSTLIWASWGAYLFVIITAIFYKDFRLIFVTLAGSALLIVPLVLLRRRKLRLSSLALVLIVLGTVTFIATIGQGIRDLALVTFPIILIFAGLALERAYFRLCVGLTLAAAFWLGLGEEYGWYTAQPLNGSWTNWFYLIGVTIILLVAALAVDLLATNMRRNLELARTEVAQRKQAEETNRQFAAIVESSDDAIIGKTLDGIIYSWNKGAEKTYGFTASEAIGQSISILTPPGQGDELVQILAKVKSEGYVKNVETERRCKNGQLIWVSLTVSPVMDEHGNIVSASTIAHDITERKQAEAKYHNLFENAIEGIFQSTPAGQFITGNPALARMLGYDSPEEMMAGINNLSSLYVQPGRREEYKQLIERDGAISSFESEVYRKDGSTLWISENGLPVRDEHGQVIHYEGTLNDISGRKQAEEALRKSESTLQAVLQSTADGILAVGAENEVLYANDRFAEIWRIPPEILASRDDSALLQYVADQLSDPQSFLKKVRELYKSREESFDTLDFKDGRVFERLSSPLLQGAETRGRVWSFRDITQRKQTEVALRQAEEKFRTLVEQSPAIIYLVGVGLEAQVNYISPQIEQVLGFTPEEWKKQPGLWESLLHPEDRERVLAESNHADLTEEPFRSEYRIYTRDGRVVWLYDESRQIYDEQGNFLYILGSETDITDRKQAEQQLKDYSEHLEEMVEERTHDLREAQEKNVRQEKLAVLGQMAGSVGHELRNPLGVINTAVYYLKMVQPDADEKIKKHHSMIEQQVRISNKIITDLLDFARVKPAEREQASVAGLVRQALERFPVPQPVQVTLELPADLPGVFVDPRQLEQVLGNLITNACQAMVSQKNTGTMSQSSTTGVAVKSAAAGVLPEGGRLTISACAQDGFVIIAVNDTGVGIPLGNMSKLFEPLFTTRKEGIGLGLPVCKKLAEANGGRIEVASELGQGSTFTVYLPSAGKGDING